MSQEDQDAASNEVEQILGATKPKHIVEGVTSGVGYILRGAVGACGAALLMPTLGAAEGHKEMGIVGGVIGGVGGVVGGVIQAANVMGGGIVTGLGQVVRGAAATPAAVVSPSKGKWWNANEGRWVRTNLLDEERWIKTQSQYDEDILGSDAIPEDERPEQKEDGRKVKDTYYYDLLGLDPSVDSPMVKRRYFIIARKYSPDRCGANAEAQEEFQNIGRAYMILTNEELRAKYDRVGRDGLWKDEEEPPDIDPNMLYTFLFGSEKFADYVGRLAAATSARVGDQENTKVSLEQARLLQKRRVTRLALKLADRLQKWAEEDMHNSAKADWITEGDFLSDASYGIELVHVIGKVYTLSAVQFLGSLDSGLGMPSISKWAKRQVETTKVTTKKVSAKVKNVGGDQERISFNKTVGTAIDKSVGDADLEEVALDILKKSHLQAKAIEMMWTQTVVDITTTLHEVAQMVLYDQNVTADVRKKRGEALFAKGEIFQKAEGKSLPIPEQEGLEEVAFHAMLDTVWRQETASRQHSVAEENA